MEKGLSISVVIPTHGGRSSEMLKRTLLSISQAALPQALERIIVVENGPRSNTEEVCHELGRRLPIAYLYSAEAGVSNARNLGVRHASSDMLLFFDDDVRVSPNAFVEYENAFRRFDIRSHFFGGPTMIDYESPPDAELVEFLPNSARGFVLKEQSLGVMPLAERFLGANHAIAREHFITLQGYDALGADGVNAGPMGEETRLQDRLIAVGVSPVYVPNALVWHYVPAASCNLAWLRKRYARYGFTYAMLDQARNKNANVRTLFRVPYWVYRKQFEIALQRIGLFLSRAPRRERLRAMFKAQEFLGRVEAYRLHERD